MSWSTTKALRLILAMVVVGSLASSGTFAQEEKKDDKKLNEKTAGRYQYLEIHPVYDDRLASEIVKLDERYAENYKSLDADEKKLRLDAKRTQSEARGKRNTILKTVRSVLDGEQSLEQHRASVTGWFERVVFPEMTQLDEASMQKLPKMRNDFFRNYTQRTRMSAAGHTYIVGTTLANMKYIAENNFHPGVRYHAMLMIGELNDREAVLLGSPKSPPVPYGKALPLLLGSYTNEKQIEAVRVAALLGILRHAELLGSNMPAESRDPIIDTMLATLTAPAGNRTPDGHAWIQRRAVDVLGKLKNVGAGGKVAKKLMDILLDEKSSLAMRCSAAVAYGNLDFSGGTDPQVAKLAATMGQMIAAECRTRLDWLASEQEILKKRRLAGQYGTSGGTFEGTGGPDVIKAEGGSDSPTDAGGFSAGGYGSGGFTPELPSFSEGGGYGMEEVDPEKAATELEKHRLKALRRRLKYPIFCAQVALGGELQRNGNVAQQQDWKLKSFLKTKEDSDFVVDLADKLNDLQLATNAGIEKKEDKRTSVTSRTEPKDKDDRLPTEQFKDELLLAVRKVEDALRKAPASARPAPPADDGPLPVGPVGPAPPSGPAGPAPVAPGPAPAPAPAPAPGPAPGPAPPAGPAGPVPVPPAGS